MADILILHGWYGRPEDAWFPWAKQEFEKLGHKVTIPFLSDPEKPTLQDWMSCALRSYQLTEDSILIGHSLGAVLAMNILMRTKVCVRQLITVSGWDYWDLTPAHKSFFEEPIDHQAIIDHSRNRTVIHSSNDPYYTVVTAHDVSTRLQAECIILENLGHIGQSDRITELPVLLDVVQKSQ